ncbi:MAG: lysine 2,3-aminomutase [Anaerolineaceae bacterium]|nr:lysine 2,3-aminomutase [Anaerolineaceae bacterium]
MMTQVAQAYQPFTRNNIHTLPQFQRLDAETQHLIRVTSAVFPFRTNRYVADELIDWENVPRDPIYQLTFPQRGMLNDADFRKVSHLIETGASRQQMQDTVHAIRLRHNPHPAGQMEYNVPRLDGEMLNGIQHKYDETVLFFPSRGQTCHAYCSYCFRWPQFVHMDDLKFAAKEADGLVRYLRLHTEVTDVLLTGGDPMIMTAKALETYILPLLTPELAHIQTIRIGTKAVAYWPQRFVSDPDADDLLRLFEAIRASGRHVAIMAHYSHHREMSTPIAQEAVRRLRNAGCEIRTQAPLMRHINNRAEVWANIWQNAVTMGMIPYYMFVSRDTGPKRYFEVPLVEALRIFRQAYTQVSGLGRTVRGPVMSATPGKVHIQGTAHVAGEKAFVLSFLQGRDPDWAGRPFFARFDPEATWFTDLRPLADKPHFFYKAETISA